MFLNKTKKFWLKLSVIALSIAIVLGGLLFVLFNTDNTPTKVLTVEESQKLLDDTFKTLPKGTAYGSKYVFENTTVKVDSVSKGNEKNLLLECSYTTVNFSNVFLPKLDKLFSDVYEYYLIDTSVTGTDINVKFFADVCADLRENCVPVSGKVTINAYEIKDGEFSIYLSDDVMNKITGGLVESIKKIDATETVQHNGQVVNIKNVTSIKTGIGDIIRMKNYDSEKPYTGNVFQKAVSKFKGDFYRNFIYKARWKYLVEGLGNTLAMTGASALLGIFLGFLVAAVRCTNETIGKLKIPNAVCKLYLTVFRGTPVMVQLLIIYFVILLPLGVPKFLAAVICFGLNSGAYVAEIVRGGIMSVDKGQMEAGRSLGFNYSQTMIRFIVPQAFKAVLPSLANEFITLLKESSVAFYIGVADLTQGGLKIRSLTFSAFLPLIAVAIIYLILVLILTYLVGILERRLRKSDH